MKIETAAQIKLQVYNLWNNSVYIDDLINSDFGKIVNRFSLIFKTDHNNSKFNSLH